MERMIYVIAVGGGYGTFLFEATDNEAEIMREHKANWEGAFAKKRIASAQDIQDFGPTISKAVDCLDEDDLDIGEATGKEE